MIIKKRIMQVLKIQLDRWHIAQLRYVRLCGHREQISS